MNANGVVFLEILTIGGMGNDSRRRLRVAELYSLVSASGRAARLIISGSTDPCVEMILDTGDARLLLDVFGTIGFQTIGGYRSSYLGMVETKIAMINSAGRIIVVTTDGIVDGGGNKVEVSGNVKVNGKVRVPASGDLSMGSFTSGENPAL